MKAENNKISNKAASAVNGGSDSTDIDWICLNCHHQFKTSEARAKLTKNYGDYSVTNYLCPKCGSDNTEKDFIKLIEKSGI